MSATTASARRVEEVVTRPVEHDRWDDLVEVFGSNGGCEGCWCMYWRVTSGPEYDRMRGAPARAEFSRLVRDGEVPGLLAYHDERPVGWCAVAPRPAYVRLRRSRTLRPAEPDDPGVWAVPCFYIKNEHRRRGVADQLLAAAVRHAERQGAHTIEAYPTDSEHRRYSSGELHMGTVDLFTRHGFSEVDRPSPGRVIVRRDLA
ncbi:GNAT family N-acetyltransferase [Amycolatopsis sp. YIM 10]|uniref:GNAT family N-acetyltransferase n=1 Tax=Amycolatopsis sp. YIM 10 TaxID=2653857 RepID=UPI00129005E6|nr:GNAT family N-acetyltransferase [Amycolatopsis sp. YIM 10]QFU92746.1 Acetyltransferase (GNAT) family protein [Amycolatopsis sp. YIM 10]